MLKSEQKSDFNCLEASKNCNILNAFEDLSANVFIHVNAFH